MSSYFFHTVKHESGYRLNIFLYHFRCLFSLTCVVNVIRVAVLIIFFLAVVTATTGHDEVTGSSDVRVLCGQEVNPSIRSKKWSLLLETRSFCLSASCRTFSLILEVSSFFVWKIRETKHRHCDLEALGVSGALNSKKKITYMIWFYMFEILYNNVRENRNILFSNATFKICHIWLLK